MVKLLFRAGDVVSYQGKKGTVVRVIDETVPSYEVELAYSRQSWLVTQKTLESENRLLLARKHQ